MYFFCAKAENSPKWNSKLQRRKLLNQHFISNVLIKYLSYDKLLLIYSKAVNLLSFITFQSKIMKHVISVIF